MTCPQETPHEETNIAAAERIWLGPAGPGPQTRLFRKTIRTDEMPRSVRLELYAETVYHLWVNGQYVQRGPTFHHAHRRPVTVIDLASYWHAGANTLAVLVYAPVLRGTHTSAGFQRFAAGLALAQLLFLFIRSF